MKPVQMLWVLSLCVFMGAEHALYAATAGVSDKLDALAVKLKDQLERAGDSVRHYNENIRNRFVSKMNSFDEAIAKEELSGKIDEKLTIIQDEIQSQFDQFRIQLGSIVSESKDRAKLENKVNTLQKKVETKVANFAGHMKTQSSRGLQNIRKKAARLSDQVASVLDVNKNDRVATKKEDESVAPTCDVANSESPVQEKVSAS